MNPIIEQIKETAKNVKLLYVEDDAVARDTTFKMLNNIFDEKNITIGVDGLDGLEKFQKGKFDLIITDINMPKLSGLDMLEQIHEIDRNVSVIIFSAYNESAHFLRAIKLSVDGFIIKPLAYEQFLETLEKILKKISLGKRDEEYHTYLEEEIKKRTQEIENKLLYDDLTGLLSRYSFFEDVKHIKTPILFMVDINKFRVINEIYGSNVGSDVLISFAKFLTNFCEQKDYKAYRLSGDEFILLDDKAYIDHERYEEEFEEFFQSLKDLTVKLPHNDEISIEATIGISTSQHNPYESVKIALEYAKTHKQHYAMYSKAIDNSIEEKNALQWKQKIKHAIATKGIVPVYQGIVDQHEKTKKYEVLMRIKDDITGELITPWNFLNIAIKTGLYEELSSSIIFQALNKINETELTMSINFAYSDIANRIFSDNIEEFIIKYPKVGKLVIFEITESQIIEDYDTIKKFILRFRRHGVRFAIDDFGSGFSNFEYILEMEPDYIKIDGSLIKNIDEDEKALILVRAIVQFSHELGIKIIAEFVHSEAVFKILKGLNIDEYQGFYFHEPLETIE